jgi:YfiH family protein
VNLWLTPHDISLLLVYIYVMQYIVPTWPTPKHVHAFTTTRQGGYSLPPYSSFNLAHHVGDDRGYVEQNRQLLSRILQLPSDPIWLQQTHGNKVLVADLDQGYKNSPADAITTTHPNVVCVVMTADCLPLLLCNFKGTQVAAIHAGWKGLAAGVIQQAVNAMGEAPHELMAWLGPAIGPEAYEVAEEVRLIFLRQNETYSPAFKPKAGKWLANLYQLATLQLHTLGIKTVYGGEYCTYNNEQSFYSFRRDRGITGRMATLIWLSR